MKKISFDEIPLGPYSEETLKKQWGNVTNIKGVAEGRAKIVDLEGEHVLEATFLKGKLGPTDGGVSWRYRFDDPADEYTAEYKIRVNGEFNYVRGGKLPGLCGGSNPRGGAREKEEDGFSARVMWRETGTLVQYVYYLDENSQRRYGKDFIWTTNENKRVEISPEMWNTLGNRFQDRIYLDPGIWHTFKTIVKMNAPGHENGKIITWHNGEEVLNVDLSFRKDLSFNVDSFQFVVYFGGNDETWFPVKDEKIYFKDFYFSHK